MRGKSKNVTQKTIEDFDINSLNLLNITQIALIYFELIEPGRYNKNIEKDKKNARTNFIRQKLIIDKLQEAIDLYKSSLDTEIKDLLKALNKKSIKKA
ncbi:MAG: hypothetical protein MUC49_21225 [Raineya sp.]|jgi:hypothetical protein|nr:hypothetical protein [Raineya sp.]